MNKNAIYVIGTTWTAENGVSRYIEDQDKWDNFIVEMDGNEIKKFKISRNSFVNWINKTNAKQQ